MENLAQHDDYAFLEKEWGPLEPAAAPVRQADNAKLAAIVETLTPQQREAVEHRGSPLVILAGAGTGKTTALTARIAHIIASGDAIPEEILAVTFTNKAAKELKVRLQKRFDDELHGMTVGTFHSICAKMLRDNFDMFGVKQDFVIMDSDDQKRMVKRIARSIYGKNCDPDLMDAALEFIEEVRSNPERRLMMLAESDQAIYNIYAQYEKLKREDGVLDFTDLIAIVTDAFHKGHVDPAYFANQYKHVLVDEYQDTNGLQFAWLKHLTHDNPNLAVVGDDDQVLYSWRGARIENILKFPELFDNTKIIRLEQNFRSTGHILHVANELISHNETRLGKTLVTDDHLGEKVRVIDFETADDEATMVVRKIKATIAAGVSPAEIAILSRASHVLNIIEQRLTFEGIPYVLSGGKRFQDKAEIRDAMAYLRLAANPEDSSAFERVVNTPKRGMGEVAIKKIVNACEKAREARANLTLLDIARNHSVGKTLSGSVPEQLGKFVEAIRSANRLFWRGGTAATVLQHVLEESGYLADLDRQIEEAEDSNETALMETLKVRRDNLADLVTIGADKQPLELVEHLGLSEDGRAKPSEAVWVGTIHAAKGLEFPMVFGIGWEENILPSWQSINGDEGENVDEERRCAYVLVTRARKLLFLTYTGERFQKAAIPSRFITDLPQEAIEGITIDSLSG